MRGTSRCQVSYLASREGVAPSNNWIKSPAPPLLRLPTHMVVILFGMDSRLSDSFLRWAHSDLHREPLGYEPSALLLSYGPNGLGGCRPHYLWIKSPAPLLLGHQPNEEGFLLGLVIFQKKCPSPKHARTIFQAYFGAEFYSMSYRLGRLRMTETALVERVAPCG